MLNTPNNLLVPQSIVESNDLDQRNLSREICPYKSSAEAKLPRYTTGSDGIWNEITHYKTAKEFNFSMKTKGPYDTLKRSPKEFASDIMDTIQKYGRHIHVSHTLGQCEWIGRSIFLDTVEEQVSQDKAIKMILPAFPWKSINKIDKVLGSLPDLGEVLALARLNRLREDIKMVYPKGGEVTIATDGLVFDDILGIPDDETWKYSEVLISIATEKGFQNIKLLRVMDILGLTNDQIVTKDTYPPLAAKSRSMLSELYGRSESEIQKMIRSDEDTLLTYRGFIRFLEPDLKYSSFAQGACSGTQYKKCVKKVAKSMMIRAESFTKLLRNRCSGYLRLSVHPSSGAVKLSMPLIIQKTGGFPKTPWHCAIAVSIDGSSRAVHSKEVRDTHRLIFYRGRSYYYREKSTLWDWDDDRIAFEPQYPNGLLIHPQEGFERHLTLEQWQVDNIHQLARTYQGPIEVVGFSNTIDALPT